MSVFFCHGVGEWANASMCVKSPCGWPHRVLSAGRLCGWLEFVSWGRYELTINITTGKLFFNKSDTLSFFITHMWFHVEIKCRCYFDWHIPYCAFPKHLHIWSASFLRNDLLFMSYKQNRLILQWVRRMMNCTLERNPCLGNLNTWK